MKLAIISGSHRLNSQSEKVANYVKEVALSSGVASSAEIISLAGNPIPLWDEGVWANEERWQQVLLPIQTVLRNSDAIIVITPEWHGQVPSGLKNLMLLLGVQEVGHKPALIISVSGSDGGAYPVAELRMNSYKNNRICYLPEHLIIRKVNTVFNANPADNDASAQDYFHKRLVWDLSLLQAYAKGLSQVRASAEINPKDYPFGM
ncbi:NADPH-dependent FMN reductase [Thiofilum flexile]|uniref:NADPH-dependent FMN reductase n=1 Tax=Thiofilum flexile TaxID=125627 RepID=UPI00036BBB18|nr:NAD(P)H-dependent oxidoreductase [Thiofilum flexile]